MVSLINNKIMVWNCRGAASKAFKRVSKQYLKDVNMNIVVIMETRMDHINLGKNFKNLGFDSLVGFEVRGYSGGIVVALKSTRVKVDLLQSHFQFLHTKIKFEDTKECIYTPIYASSRKEGRKVLWHKLINLSKQIQYGWLIGGNFNDIMLTSEKRGGAPASTSKCVIFRDRVDSCKLMELCFIGHKFTWRGPIFHGATKFMSF